jgi:hypothetical protein
MRKAVLIQLSVTPNIASLFEWSFYSLVAMIFAVTHYALRLLYLLDPLGDSSPRQVVGRELDRHAVPGDQANGADPQLAGQVGHHYMAVVELHPPHIVWGRLKDPAFNPHRA